MEGTTIYIPAEHADKIGTIKTDAKLKSNYPVDMTDGVVGGEIARDEKGRYKIWN